MDFTVMLLGMRLNPINQPNLFFLDLLSEYLGKTSTTVSEADGGSEPAQTFSCPKFRASPKVVQNFELHRKLSKISSFTESCPKFRSSLEVVQNVALYYKMPQKLNFTEFTPPPKEMELLCKRMGTEKINRTIVNLQQSPQLITKLRVEDRRMRMIMAQSWTGRKFNENSTSPVRYDDGRGEFVVNVKGLFYLYCQVHFNEDRSSYIKLDLLLDSKLIFRCLQEFSTTAASIRDPTLKTCSVSGLVILRPGNSLRIKTLPKVSLRIDHFLTYFGLFQVH
ncbi:unnamed protein product [Ranitomeya imitator]|uniref:THD domain-containing protein n=1 Tax=Ranitomeya imitator TaxID=111125 RepID=A0ABN9LAF9_9NEOB|nr:unnamed protein product [Ranitomeya imitator]